jgi:aspartate carbamoyltransferase catalytic subunit
MFPSHILSANQFLDHSLLDSIFQKAVYYKKAVLNKQKLEVLSGSILATLFFEPSTRTRLSFEAAMLRLGGQVISCENASGHSSAKKGESIADTARMISGYGDVMVMRHTENGAALEASKYASIPVINAGDGSGEHPTQALLDMFTIHEKFGEIKNLKVGLLGDLLYGRTVHSLSQILASFEGVELYFISPEKLKLPERFKELLQSQNVKMSEIDYLNEVIGKLDVLYVTRIQKERFEDLSEYEGLKHSFRVNADTLTKMKPESIILHPLPRVNEITTDVDSDPRAKYFDQAKNGLYVRMALLEMVLGN